MEAQLNERLEHNPSKRKGWIKLWRSITDSQVFQNEGILKVWIWCLLKATHFDNWVSFTTGKGVTEVFVGVGQFIFGRGTAAEELNMDESTVWKRMLKLRDIGNLKIDTGSHFSVVTITNWELYQGRETVDNKGLEEIPQKSDTQNYIKGDTQNEEIGSGISGNCRADFKKSNTQKEGSKEQASNTKKNNRNKNIYVEGSDELRLASLLLHEIRKNKPDFKEPNLQVWAKDVDLTLRVDNRSAERIEKVIRWAQSDHADGAGSWKGWAANILSPGKLREKFDELEMKMGGKAKPRERGPKYQKVN